jgi:single-strand DNA-binding protein
MNNYKNAGVNRVLLAGYVASEPRWHAVGKSRFLHFSLITEETIRGTKGSFTHQEEHRVRIESFNVPEGFTVAKGDLLFVQGRLTTHAFTDDDHVKRYRTDVVINHLERISTQNIG